VLQIVNVCCFGSYDWCVLCCIFGSYFFGLQLLVLALFWGGHGFSSSFITFVALFCSVLGCLQALLFEFEPKDLLAISPKIKDLMAKI
jgi:hypothetical protein